MAKDPETRAVTIPASEVELAGDLTVPEARRAWMLFAHGSGSSAQSAQSVRRPPAREAGLATLLFDLLTPEEAGAGWGPREVRFDVFLLTRRLPWRRSS